MFSMQCSSQVLAVEPCLFLSHLSPAQMTTMLVRWSQHHDKYVNPFWLRNGNINQGKNEENVLAIFPKTAFYLLPPAIDKKALFLPVNSQVQSLRLKTITRKSLPNFLELEKEVVGHHQNHSETSNLLQNLTINLTNNHSVASFQKKMIDYMQTQNTATQHMMESLTQPVNRFIDGLLGFIGYDVMANDLAQGSNCSDNNQEEQSQIPNNYFFENQPLAYLAHYPLYLSCKEEQGLFHWKIHATTIEAKEKLKDCISWLKKVIKKNRPLIFKTKKMFVQPRWSYSDYQQAFEKTQKYLYAGDCYQINLTQEWLGRLPSGECLANYLSKLDAYTQAPFAGYIQMQGVKKFELLSCSPELFCTFTKQLNGEISISTKPIKGTRPRGKTEQQDLRLKKELANSEKDLAENVMIVDLLRNDLGKYAKNGTVKVPKRFEIETFSNVHHMVSTITATIKEETHPLEMLLGSLPAGSITGTPKKRSVEIINELENKPRGAYCGTMGYLNFDGTGQWNVLIRTLQAVEDELSLWAGGGITVASDCESEYKECFDKVGNLLNILQN